MKENEFLDNAAMLTNIDAAICHMMKQAGFFIASLVAAF